MTKKGLVVPAKPMGPGCKPNCRTKCHNACPPADREEAYKKFRRTVTRDEEKWAFIVRHVTRKESSEHKVDAEFSRRQHTFVYHITIQGKLQKVCKQMFLSTFQISNSCITTAFNHLSAEGTISPCKTGKHNKRANALSPGVKESVREHIEKFPKVESHYIRKDSAREYIEEQWNVSRMHRAYLKWMQKRKECEALAGETDSIPVDALSDKTSDDEFLSDHDSLAESVNENAEPVINVKNPDVACYKLYLDIFNNEYNISTHKSKKDQCELCCRWNDNPGLREELKEEYDQHIKLKLELRRLLQEDKESTKEDGSIAYCNFDLQKVLYCPQGLSSGFYYNSKLSTYNFTVFEIRSFKVTKGYCFTWREGICAKGSNEVCSCVLRYFGIATSEGVKEFKLSCDNCTGQNKNRQVFAMLNFAAAKYGIKITLKYLLKGHTQSEGDNMHANIETASKGKKLLLPSHWRKVMRAAIVDPSQKYKVFKLNQENCYDFKDLVKKQNWDVTTDGAAIKWMDIREATFEDGVNVSIRYDIFEEQRFTINVNRKRGRPVVLKNYVFNRAYNEPLPISESVRKGLTTMCKNGTIPIQYQGFYKKILEDHPCREK